MAETLKPGTVYLVGAGPGDPGLITLRGIECLRRADVVLYDGLVNPLLLRHTSAHCERTCRTGEPSGKVLHQQEINAHLVAAAKEGKTVVRLKGGDPFIFGRGSEEAAALAAEGIPFEVVPGVTAATAAAVYAGISLTHREHASAVAFITGHEDPRKDSLAIDYDVLARFPGTLVFYMGLNRVEAIARSLIASGKPSDTPACVISRATRPEQRTVSAPLSQLAEQVCAAGLHAPSLILVGDCVALRETIAWYEHRPLFGVTIGITRAGRQADSVISRCLELGARPVLLPAIDILPVPDWREVDEALTRLHEYDWIIFTSSNGVESLLSRLWQSGGDARRFGRAKLAAIGPATADALLDWHLRCDLVPEQYRAEALAAALKAEAQGRRMLWVRASRGRDVLPAELRAAGARLDELVVYQNVDTECIDPAETELLAKGEIDWIALSSPSIARSVARLLPDEAKPHLGSRIRLAAISPVTESAAREAGLPVNAVASTYTWEGIFEAIQAEHGKGRGSLNDCTPLAPASGEKGRG